jgi:hypothetical protein
MTGGGAPEQAVRTKRRTRAARVMVFMRGEMPAQFSRSLGGVAIVKRDGG